MPQTPITQCPKCGANVLRVKLDVPPYFTLRVNATPDGSGHVTETGNGTAHVLLPDRSDAGGADIYKAHHLTCGS